MAVPLRRFVRPLVTPSILFLVCHESQFQVAGEVADLLEDVCNYRKITDMAALKICLKGKQQRSPVPRLLLMPELVNVEVNRLDLYEIFSAEELPIHYIGCLAITCYDTELPPVLPPPVPLPVVVTKCETVRAHERVWLAPEFTCVVAGAEDLALLKKFVATLLPFLTS